MDRNVSTAQSSANEPDGSNENASVEQHLLAAETAHLIRRKAHRLAARAGLPSTEIPDVTQALYEAMVRDSRNFDPTRGEWLAFAERALQFAGKNLLRKRFSRGRSGSGEISLHVLVQIDRQEGTTELAQIITESELVARTGGREHVETRESDMRLDITHFIQTLPDQIRALADSLQHESILEISRRTETPRSTLYDRLELLRRAAQDRDLSRYLD